MEILLSFAQDLEDITLYHMLKKETDKATYIDVGANDPIIDSVTKFFSLRGGGGINIEPQKDLIDKLNHDRPCDINLAVGIGSKESTLTLHGCGGLASFDAKNPFVKDTNTHKVLVIPLKNVCEKYLTDGQDIHFLKIDVEGFEKECLKGMDFKKYRPWIVCMESTLPNTNIGCWNEWEYLLINQGYIFAGMNGVNRYYVSKEKSNLKKRFLTQSQLKRKYRILNYSKVKGAMKIRKYLYPLLQIRRTILKCIGKSNC